MNIQVKTNSHEYPICIYDNFNHIENEIKKTGIKGKKACIISDDNVAGFYLKELTERLKNVFPETYSYNIHPGETSKNLKQINEIYAFLHEKRFDRSSVIIALGGGVVGDIAGFAAATYLRGVPFIQIPTSLLAQVDSSVGGKVGVDFLGNKNIIGAFYQPELVYININTLKTLPKREFNAGLAEVIKYGAIVSRDFYDYLIKNKAEIKELDNDILKKVVISCCEFKADVVAKDEKETSLREILNFGHTIGHSVETLMEFKLVHGECVAVGMVAAAYLSRLKKNKITEEDILSLKDILRYFELPVNIKGIPANDIYDQMFLDKKVKNNSIRFVLLEKTGKAYTDSSLDRDEILRAVNYIL